tara:strand:+ start:93 stop:410 length:318 start_codon:yes stop_codon:yes gene_type:complete
MKQFNHLVKIDRQTQSLKEIVRELDYATDPSREHSTRLNVYSATGRLIQVIKELEKLNEDYKQLYKDAVSDIEFYEQRKKESEEKLEYKKWEKKKYEEILNNRKV